MKHVASILFSVLFVVLVHAQVHPENYTYAEDDTLMDDTAASLRNEFSFHIIPIYQIFSGATDNYNVLLQYKHQFKYSRRAITASVYFHESVGEIADSSRMLPLNDTIFMHRGMHQSSYIGGMIGHEWFTWVNDRWKLYYGGNVLFFYGRDLKETYKYQFVKDSIGAYYSFNPEFQSTDSLLYRSQIFRPGVSIYGGVEYRFNPTFSLSMMALNNIYYDIVKADRPVVSTNSQVNFDLLRIFLMLKVYF